MMEIISDKINCIEKIDETLVEEIYIRLKQVCEEHNKKITEWFDFKYSEDLDVLKNNFESFNKINNFYLTNSFVIIENKKIENL